MWDSGAKPLGPGGHSNFVPEVPGDMIAPVSGGETAAPFPTEPGSRPQNRTSLQDDWLVVKDIYPTCTARWEAMSKGRPTESGKEES